MCTLSRQLDECLGAEDALVREALPVEVSVHHVQGDKLAPHRVVDEGGHGVDVKAECVLLVDGNVVDVAHHGSRIVYYS